MVEYNDKYFSNIESKICPIRFFNYDCLDLLSSNLSTDIFYDYFLSMIEYKLKNLWNHIILKWIQSKQKIKNKNYKKSIYYNQNYEFIHCNINDKKLNQLINDFINEDIFKAVFVIECINCL